MVCQLIPPPRPDKPCLNCLQNPPPSACGGDPAFGQTGAAMNARDPNYSPKKKDKKKDEKDDGF
jgi:hypothetical protein